MIVNDPCVASASAIRDIPTGGVLTIDLNAVRQNVRILRDRVRPASVAAVLKADAYGLGVCAIAPVLYAEGCRRFFVADLNEAFALQHVLPEGCEFFILNGVPPGGEEIAAAARFRPVLNALEDVAAWANLCTSHAQRYPAAIQVDTGMSRLGLTTRDVDELTSMPSRLEAFDAILLMSHLACADEPGHAANAEQLARFLVFASIFPCTELSFANSGGVFLGSAFHGDCVRAGIALYGANPTASAGNPMQPVVQLDARVIQLRDIPAGIGVGYGLSFTAPTKRTLATVGVGYADGWPRSLSGKGAAYFRGQRLPIVGRVSMDSFILDVSELPRGQIAPNDFVELIGPNQSVDDVARDAGSIAYEILTSLGKRHARIYLDDPMQEL